MLNKEQAILNEGIGLILSGWDTMQLAVEYGFGVRHSHAKAELKGLLDELHTLVEYDDDKIEEVPNGSSDDEDKDTWMDNDETIDMMMDATDHCSNRKPEAMPVDEQMADDGWTLVPCRKHKGNRN
ncbi:unnamed protein product [Arabis nemorensis]|uniref:Uncharacterized protein n=1 Tax=Arabis nemorensis TaxID=586526 RepID=A0A565CGX7_9BRAS|nr:unnamed protein product [Arabis nemorensis]